MSRIYKFAFLFVLIVSSLACGLITNPINQAKGLASTAQAVASSMPLETLQALPSAMPSGIPNIPNIPGMGNLGQYLNPIGKPLSEWNSIPIMPAATAGQEFNKNTYSFKISGTVQTAQAFYADKLKALGWTSSFSAQGGSGTQGGVMLFTKGNSTLTITIVPSDNALVVLLISQ